MDLKVLLIALICVSSTLTQKTEIEGSSSNEYQIEGTVFPPEIASDESYDNLVQNTDILLHTDSSSSRIIRGFLKSDGSFVISKIPMGSFILEVINPDYLYEQIRVEINSKGKIRARKISHIQPSQVIQLAYPLKLKALTSFRYFTKREQWKFTDFIYSPMVLMMVLPLVLLLILPKLMNEKDKKELDNMQLLDLGNQMPNVSDMLSKIMSPPKQEPERTKNKKRSSRND